jgi:hypothetical protein
MAGSVPAPTDIRQVHENATRPQAAEFGRDQMRDWYLDHDFLATLGEHIIDESSTFTQTVEHVLHSSRLTETTAVTYCPTRPRPLHSSGDFSRRLGESRVRSALKIIEGAAGGGQARRSQPDELLQSGTDVEKIFHPDSYGYRP